MVYPGFTTGPVAPAPATPSPSTSPLARPVSTSAGTPSPSPGPAPSAPTTQLDSPHELNASAGIARQIATDLDNANGKAGHGAHSLGEYASTAATKIRGFSFGGALTSATERWTQQCKTLHDKLTGTADKLDETQRNYAANEARTAGQFGSSH
ncbi:hypothetical protein [Kitasatospora sp. NPDC088351]|uniref:hypothetical protein n=1 Tax=unclassified Kitasatospora TaxID=2633591 RepID=UPI0034434B6E